MFGDVVHNSTIAPVPTRSPLKLHLVRHLVFLSSSFFLTLSAATCCFHFIGRKRHGSQILYIVLYCTGRQCLDGGQWRTQIKNRSEKVALTGQRRWAVQSQCSHGARPSRHHTRGKCHFTLRLPLKKQHRIIFFYVRAEGIGTVCWKRPLTM